MAQSLDAPLADLLHVGLLAKHAHWNVRGPNFRAIHLFLDELADLSGLAADEVAERAITLGAPPDGRARTIADTSSLPSVDAGPIDDHDVVGRFGAILDALKANAINCGNLFSTDAAITQNGFTSLEDDKSIVPAEAVLPLISVDRATPQVEAVLGQVSAKLDTESLTAMNAQVQSEGLAESEVAARWLDDNGFTGSS